jgi:MFS family permease
LVGSLLALAGAATLAAVAPNAWILGLALTLAGPASGCACTLAEGALVESEPEARERQMTWWTLAGACGDLTAPLLVAVAGLAGLGWRAAMLVVAGLVAVVAVSAASDPRLDVLELDDEDDEGPQSLREALRNRSLVVWLLGTATCALLDEILVALAALHMRLDLHATEGQTAFALGAWAFGAAVGLLGTERLLRRGAPRRLLMASGLACTCACLSWLWIDDPLGATIGLLAIGLTAAPLYPIATAQLYATCPRRPALIGAASQLLAPIEIALPWLLGALADTVGLPWALVVLAIEPLAILPLAIAAWPTRPRADDVAPTV